MSNAEHASGRRRTGRSPYHAHLALLARLALLAVPLAACTGRAVQVAGAPADPAAAEIRAALQGSADAWNAADLDGHVAIYADSATFMTGSGPAVGRHRTRALLERSFWQGGRPAQQLDFSELQVRMLGPDHALVLGRFRLSGGGQAEQTGRFSLVWERRPEGWRVIHDHSS